ncbi:tetrahydromethanopterin S-methyltransferase subunit MtrG [Methanopyrus sp.]
MAEEESVPKMIAPEDDIREIHSRLDEIERRLDFVWGEVYQRFGKRIGRDIGILYGLVIGLYLCMLYILLGVAFR